MDTTKFTMGIVGLVVIILMVTGAVIPAVEDAQYDITEKEQNTAQKFHALKGADLNTTISVNDSAVLTIGDKTYTWTETSNLSVLISDEFTVEAILYNGDCLLKIFDYQNNIYNGSIDTITLTISSGTVSYTLSATDYTAELKGDVLILDDNGDYGIFQGRSATLYVDLDSKVYMVCTNVDVSLSSRLDYVVSGTMDKLKACTYFQTMPTFTDTTDTTTITVTNLTKSDDGHTYILKPDVKVTLSVNLGGSSASLDANNAWNASILAPIEYTVTDSNDSGAVLLGIIPLLLIIVAVLYAVRLMGASRN